MKSQNIKSLEEIRHEVGEDTFRGWEALTEVGYFHRLQQRDKREKLKDYQERMIREFYHEHILYSNDNKANRD